MPHKYQWIPLYPFSSAQEDPSSPLPSTPPVSSEPLKGWPFLDLNQSLPLSLPTTSKKPILKQFSTGAIRRQ